MVLGVVATFFFVTLIGLVITWIIVCRYLHSKTYPHYPIDKITSLLVIFPHPDDEVLTSGGLSYVLTQRGVPVHIAFLTQGERGTSDAHLETTLGPKRVLEAQLAASHLGATVQVEDLGDGELMNKREAVRAALKTIIAQRNPSHVITYDLSGFYGHNDHIALSEELTALVAKDYPSVTLLYGTFPDRVLESLDLPVHMATSAYVQARALPTHRVFVARGIVAKVKALYAHRSQYRSFRQILPIKWLPLWVLASFGVYEYFSDSLPAQAGRGQALSDQAK